jgi:predicted PurR-regulated permease PerM
MSLTPDSGKSFSREMLDVLIRAGLIAILMIACYLVFHPFLNLMLWSVILAITLYPLHARLARHLGGKQGLTATLLVTVAIAVLLVPVYLLSMSLADSVSTALVTARTGSVHVPPPAASVAQWPIVGPRIYDVWTQAATDLTGLAKEFAPQLKAASRSLLGKLAGLGIGLLIFIAALIISGIFMAFARSGERSAVQIASRMFGPARGPGVVELCTATVRAVAQGVVGIAFIQMLLVGVGFVVMGVPAAGLLALAVLLLGIMQVPATLITVPVIIYIFATRGFDVATIVFAIYEFVAGLADNVLKPLLLGRGVAVPMPVILIGALGGMVTNGIIGLFTGPVLLAVGYQLFWQWVRDQQASSVPPTETPGAPAPE